MKKIIYLITAVIIVTLIGCSGKTDKEYMESAKAKIENGNIKEGIEDYKKVYTEFPDSKYAVDALKENASLLQKQNNYSEAAETYELIKDDYPESDYAPEATYELALIYQNKLVKNISDKESLEKAADLYRSLYDNYPDNKKAPMALFMSAFIKANELHEYDEATDSYNLFLEKYPNHELASSAKEEIENMGLSPDDILKDKSDI